MKHKKKKCVKPSRWLPIVFLLLFFAKAALSIVSAETAEETPVSIEEVQETQSSQLETVESFQEIFENTRESEIEDDGTTDTISEPEWESTTTSEPTLESDSGQEPAAGTIAGHVWLDENENGLQDVNERTLSGIVVYLVAVNDKTQVVNDTITNNQGSYEFSELASGDYYAAVENQTLNGVEYLVPVASIQAGDENKFDVEPTGEQAISYTAGIRVDDDVLIADINAGMRLKPQHRSIHGNYKVYESGESEPYSSHETLKAAIDTCNGFGSGTFTVTLAEDDPDQGEAGVINPDIHIILTSASDSIVTIRQTTIGQRHLKVNKGSLLLKSITLEGIERPYDHSDWGGTNGGIELNGGMLTMEKDALVTKTFGNKGGAVEARDNSQVQLRENGKIDYNQSSDTGGGIFAADSIVELSGDSQVSGNIGQWRSGGVYLERSQLTINDSGSITGNIAKNNEGGGINADINSTVLLNNGSITHNIADKIKQGSGDGAGLYIKGNSTVTMRQGEISHNNCTNGGGLYITNGTLTVEGGRIQNNTVSGDGGGIRAVDNAVVTIAAGSINDNKAAYGGGISANGGSKLTMSGGSINQNIGENRGGAVNLDTDTTHFTMIGGTISQNTSRTGSGILADKASVSLTNATISENHATGDESGSGNGGGLFVENGGKATITNSQISSNTAFAGGGINISENSQFFEITDSFITGNRAREHGGGLLVKKTEATIDNVKFKGNVANRYGAGVRMSEEAKATINNSEISGNEGQYGGGISANLGSEVSLMATDVKENAAVYRGAEGGDGGGVNIDLPNTIFEMTGGVIEKNRAESSGGGLLATAKAVFLLNDVTINENTADTHGGGIFLKEDGDGTVENSSLTNNTALTNGGGARLEERSKLTIDSSNVNGNTAAHGGGLSANTKSTVEMINPTSEISGNSANYYGGGVNIDHQGTTFTMDAGTINHNSGTNGGGVTASDNARFIMNEGIITGNTASNNGGGIYLQASALLEVNKGEIIQNDAASSGGGIFTEDYYYHTPVDAEKHYKNIIVHSTKGTVDENTSFETQERPEVTNGSLKFDKNYLDNDEVNYFPGSYRLVYHPGEGTGAIEERHFTAKTPPSDESILSSEVVSFSPPADRANYVLQYWCETEDGKGTRYAADGSAKIKMDGDKYLYAIWGPPTTISGVVFIDNDRDAEYDDGEELAGKVVTLCEYDPQTDSYVPSEETQTNEQGKYVFAADNQASYKIAFKVVDDELGRHGFVKKGATDRSSHANQDGLSDVITINADAQINHTINAGYIKTIVPTGVNTGQTTWMFYLVILILVGVIINRIHMIRKSS